MSGKDQNQGLMGWQGPLWTFLESPVALQFSSHKERGAKVVGEMQPRAAIGSLPSIGSTFQMEEVMAPMSLSSLM